MNGKSQVVSSDAGIWKATFGNIVVRRRESVITYRALAALLDGRLEPILVPLCRGYQPIYPGASELGLYDPVPHSDGSLFSDGTGYVGGSIKVTLASSAAVRATSIGVLVAYGGDIQPGQHFSIGERLYRIRTFDPASGAMTIWPPLREAATIGTELNFDDPVCRMRLASDDALDLQLALRRFGNPTVNFVEDV